MDKKTKNLFKKLNAINSVIIDNVNELNIDSLSASVGNFEKKIQATISQPKTEEKQISEQPIWKKFPEMTEEGIREEFRDVDKYPTIESIKDAIRGYIDLQKVSKVKTRETLITHIIETYGRGRFISKIGSNVS